MWLSTSSVRVRTQAAFAVPPAMVVARLHCVGEARVPHVRRTLHSIYIYPQNVHVCLYLLLGYIYIYLLRSTVGSELSVCRVHAADNHSNSNAK